MNYKAVIFDFFGVVCDERFWQWVSKHVPTYQEHTDRYQALADAADKGDISKEDFYATIGRDAGIGGDQVRQEIHDEIRIHLDVVAIIETIHRSHKTALLSNADYRELERILEENGLLKHFDEVVISTKVKLIKPDPAIFKLACKKLGVSTKEAIFVDDREANLIGAQQTGLRTILFSGGGALKHTLYEAGVS